MTMTIKEIEVAQSFKEDVEAVKDQLPCGEQMDFPNTFDEFVKDYGFKDKNEVYTNGSELIPVFRVKQWLKHISTTKNDLGVDCISREQAKVAIRDKFKDLPSRVEINTILNELPSVTPQPCEDAVSRQEVLYLIADYDLSMGQVVRGIHALPSVTPQEPILDELRAEITTLQNRCYALTKGTMCAFCRYECKYKTENNS